MMSSGPGVLLAVLSRCSDKHKSREVEGLRANVRQVHKDVRANSRVVATMWEFIEAAQARAGAASRQERETTTSGSKKRKKRGGDGVGDDDYRPAPVMRVAPSPNTRSRMHNK